MAVIVVGCSEMVVGSGGDGSDDSDGGGINSGGQKCCQDALLTALRIEARRSTSEGAAVPAAAAATRAAQQLLEIEVSKQESLACLASAAVQAADNLVPGTLDRLSLARFTTNDNGWLSWLRNCHGCHTLFHSTYLLVCPALPVHSTANTSFCHMAYFQIHLCELGVRCHLVAPTSPPTTLAIAMLYSDSRCHRTCDPGARTC